jgi:hypothetical protein
MQDSPIQCAEKIIELLAETPYATANVALKIAENLLEYRVKCEISGFLQVGPQLAELPEAEAAVSQT